MFKTYKRKIHVYRAHNSIDLGKASEYPWIYVWSTNAYPTCKDAVNAAQLKAPMEKFKASFAKD